MLMEELKPYIEKAKQGDQVAFSFILNLHWNKIYTYISGKTFKQDDAEDLTIVVFTKAFDKLESFDVSKPFTSWLYTIANNTFKDYLRKINRQPEPIEIDPYDEINWGTGKNTEVEFIEDEELKRLLSVINQLPEKYKEVILLKGLEELSYEEIAKKTELSMSNVKIRLMRGKQLLADLLK